MNASSVHARPSAPAVALATGLALVVVWPFVLSMFGKDDVYVYLGPFGIAVVLAMTVARRVLRGSLWPENARLRELGVGLGVGAFMTLGTYGAYIVFARLIPSLAAHVAGLYVAASTQPKASALAWTLVVVLAEELLWRGELLRILDRRLGHWTAALLSVGSYTLAQSGSGSVIVVIAAFICGAFWTAERIATGSIVAPLVSHAIWTTTVLHLFPVTRL